MRQFFYHIREYIRWYILLSLCILNIVLWNVILHEDSKGILTFSVLDIGQGDALWIESPSGIQVIVDGGPNKNLMKEISHVTPWYDRHIDMIVVTNPDKDHYEGFIPLMKKYSVDVILESGTLSLTPEYSVLEKEITDRKIPKVLARRGQIVDLGFGAYLEILFPDRDVSLLSSNDGSIVMRLVYGQTSVLLQGDSTAKIEHYLVGLDQGELNSTILKIGHHGSKTSTTEEYINYVRPKWAVISSGKNNSYGHPHKEVLDTMNKFSIPVLDTCNNGRITFHSDGKNFFLENKKTTQTEIGCVEK